MKQSKLYLIIFIMLMFILVPSCPLNKGSTDILIRSEDDNGNGGGSGNGGSQTSQQVYRNLCADGHVYAQILSDNNILYVGGSFLNIGTCSGGGVLLDLPNGDHTYSLGSPSFPRVHGSIYSSISDGNGGFYIGGSFSKVGSTTRNNIVHIDSAGAITSFAPNVENTVRALALSGDGSVLYLGGSFTTVEGTSRNYIAAISTADGSLIGTFNPNANNAVYSLYLSGDGSTLFIGGGFTTIGGTTRNRIAAVNTSDGSLVSGFDPNTDNFVRSLVLSSDGSILYMGGHFTTVGGTTRNRIAAVNTADGSLVGGFDPNANNWVLALALSGDGSKLYMGGSFTTMGGTTRNYIAAVNTADGSLVAGFDPNADVTVWSIALSGDGSTLYIGGNFITVGGTARNYVAAVNTSDGSLISGFNPNASFLVYTLALSEDKSKLYVGGIFTIIGGTPRTRIAAINTTDGTLLSGFDPNSDGVIYSFALSGNGSILYVGGEYTAIGGLARNSIAAINTSDGTSLAGFAPNVNDKIWSLVLNGDESTLYMSGRFTTVGGTARNRIAAVNTTNGSLVSGFDPNANNYVRSLALNGDGSIIYMGGGFTTIGGSTRNRIAAVNTTNGSLVGTFSPDLNGPAYAIALSGDGSILYLSGGFTTIEGTGRFGIGAVYTTDGSLVAGFDPTLNSTNWSIALSTDDQTLYLGGEFTSVGGTARNRIAAVNTADGSLVSGFDPNAEDIVWSLVLNQDASIVYAAGQFDSMAGDSISRMAMINTDDGSLISEDE